MSSIQETAAGVQQSIDQLNAAPIYPAIKSANAASDLIGEYHTKINELSNSFWGDVVRKIQSCVPVVQNAIIGIEKAQPTFQQAAEGSERTEPVLNAFGVYDQQLTDVAAGIKPITEKALYIRISLAAAAVAMQELEEMVYEQARNTVHADDASYATKQELKMFIDHLLDPQG